MSDLSRVETLKRDSGGLFSEFLNELAPYVVVCGSFARRTETEDSLHISHQPPVKPVA